MAIDKFTTRPSEDDRKLWKATWKNFNEVGESIQLRKTLNGCSILVIVGIAGWRYKHEIPHPKVKSSTYMFAEDVSKFNIRISLNGSYMGGWDLLRDIQSTIDEAQEILEIEDAEMRQALVLLKFGGL